MSLRREHREAGSPGGALGRSRLDFLSFGRPPVKPKPAGPPMNPQPAAARAAWLDRFESALGGRREIGPEGYRLVVRRQHPATETHDGRRLADHFAVSGRALGWLGRDPALAAVDLRRAAFLDCETTGLAGGTGTKAFLIGIAYCEADGLHVEQHFLPDYDAEGAFLAGADATLSRFEALVTFNGKSFDLPLLETRLALQRRRAVWPDLPHLDLLHPARRVWRRRLESCSLTTLEERILGITREGDVPGWLIPGLYFGFLRTGNLAPLEPVFEHNRQDLLSLLILTSRLARLVTGEEEAEDPLDRYSLARLHEDLGEVERSVAGYRAALAGDLAPDVRVEVQTRLGLLCKRLRQDAAALEAWDELARGGGPRSALALVELAKHYEHRARDYARAAAVTRQALLAVTLRPALAAEGEAGVEALERRLRRLERRLRRS